MSCRTSEPQRYSRLMRFFASQAAAATGGRLVGPDVEVDGVCFDSRELRPGQLFVPIVADRDGHDFIDSSVASGAPAYFTCLGHQGATAIEVNDTLVALMDLARARRWSFGGTVIGVTGSVGKTSTKDFAHTALAAAGLRAWANERSFNNDQGLPTTLLNAPDDTEVMVLEMGMRGFGEIERLCGIAQPQIGVVTRVAEAHSDRVGGIDGVQRAKAELPRSLPAQGWAILNGDDERVRAMATMTDAQVIQFGTAEHCEVRIGGITVDELARATFRIQSPWGDVQVRLAVSGAHMALNAAAALTCVGVVGGDVGGAAEALAEASLSANRMEVVRTVAGATLLNDSYNANPTSMRAAIAALCDLPAERRFAVLGVMAEISDPAEEHAAIAGVCRARDVTLIAAGTDLYGVAPAADPVAALLEVADGALGPGDAVLTKGSRVAALDRVAQALISR
jgi:UDP-N-acetylmuramoyl-tripeptide--D-alanyl-D-alanine ligase